MNPYQSFVDGYIAAIAAGRRIPTGAPVPQPPPKPKPDAPVLAICAPHPDDECIVGALPLRLARECGWRVVNLAVTFGNQIDRRAGRLAELSAACAVLGFDLEPLAPDGLEAIVPETRANDPAHWSRSVATLVAKLRALAPRVVLYPHADDAHKVHAGTHALVSDALAAMQHEAPPWGVETEFWAPMKKPNLLLEVSPETLAEQLSALSRHVVEIERNPYHLALPAWMHDNVRRGSEILGGSGASVAAFHFATLYRVTQCDAQGIALPAWEKGKLLAASERPDLLF